MLQNYEKTIIMTLLDVSKTLLSLSYHTYLLFIEALAPFLSRIYANIYFSTINSSQVELHKSDQPVFPYDLSSG